MESCGKLDSCSYSKKQTNKIQLCSSVTQSGKGLLTPNNPHLTDFNQRVLLERHGQTAGVQN